MERLAAMQEECRRQSQDCRSGHRCTMQARYPPVLPGPPGQSALPRPIKHVVPDISILNRDIAFEIYRMTAG